MFRRSDVLSILLKLDCCLFVCSDCIKVIGGIETAFICEIETNLQMLY